MRLAHLRAPQFDHLSYCRIAAISLPASVRSRTMVSRLYLSPRSPSGSGSDVPICTARNVPLPSLVVGAAVSHCSDASLCVCVRPLPAAAVRSSAQFVPAALHTSAAALLPLRTLPLQRSHILRAENSFFVSPKRFDRHFSTLFGRFGLCNGTGLGLRLQIRQRSNVTDLGVNFDHCWTNVFTDSIVGRCRVAIAWSVPSIMIAFRVGGLLAPIAVFSYLPMPAAAIM